MIRLLPRATSRFRWAAVTWLPALALLIVSGCREGTAGEPSPSSSAPAAAASSSAHNGTPAPDATPTASAGSADNAERAQALALRVIVVDGHVDLPYRLYGEWSKSHTLGEDVSKRTAKGEFDWVRARAGGLDAPFMSIYVPAKHQQSGDAKKVADGLIDLVEAIVEGHPSQFVLAKSPADVRRNFAEKKISLPLGIENGAAIESKLQNLAHFYDRGVRYITLTHSKDNAICDSSYDDKHTHKGLSAFGREVVKEMNRLGIMVDVSHISDQAFEQVMLVSKVPVIASHSSCRHFTPGFERNMSDDMIRRLAAQGGVIMINFGSTFIDEEVRAQRDKVREAREAFMKAKGLEHDDPKVEAFDKAAVAKLAKPFSSVERVADHIDHVVKLVGIEHVGLGSDFDGVGDSLPTGLKDPSQLPNLFKVLLDRGYSESDIEKIASLNVLRVWERVAQAAQPNGASAAD